MLPSRWRSALCTVLPFLFPLAHSAPTDIPSAASFYVPNLPDLHQDPQHPLHIYAGHLSADPHAASLPATTVTAHLYFVLIKARRTADKERLMFWFNGGPGCSSFDGLMMEVGPWRIDGKVGLQTVEGGWEEYTTIVYVDQPAGTGFSYVSTDRFVHELSEVSEQFMEFLRNFYLVFPEYRHMDTYLGGESFAGQYIPYFSDAILNSTLGVPLMGAAIGNGWIDSRRQYPAYLDYALKHGLVELGSPLYDAGKKATDECVALLNMLPGEPVHEATCEGLLAKVVGNAERPSDGMCLNIYDVRLKDEFPACGMNWPYDLKNITTYLRRPDVVSSLHATAKSESWVECQTRLHRELSMHNSQSSVTVIPRVLEKIPILIFAGDQDFICNYVGIENFIQALTWNGETGLGKVETQTWTVENQPAGTWVTSRNMTYVKIFNASHMAGYDVPHVAHDMILRFMGMNFSAITDGSARIPSSVGANIKPSFIESSKPSETPAPISTKTPQQDKAMWEAYYNAGSAALVLVLIFVALGTFFWCRVRRRRLRGLPVSTNEEESIPLTRSTRGFEDQDTPDVNGDDGFRGRNKGKDRANGQDAQPIFDVGDSDEEDGKNGDLSR
ncbi:alpha beta-hydrolase [Artomyces pyxidatus]|uniref:Alpha beta-hydrolase n=1 Tax=Artomyces pyxidatus TaxID=48021 RepID=A0ACB8TJJ0_9AGAM|nr:alpha beta-hydrolase [Artomyces pyxidatus]